MVKRGGGYERVGVRRGEVRKWTDVPLQAPYVTAPLVLPLEVVPSVVPIDELMQSDPISSEVLDITLEISNVLGESLSEVCAQYFRDSDEGDVDRDLAEERDRL
jgi:hypothetical protein